jgi:hypothetical protein
MKLTNHDEIYRGYAIVSEGNEYVVYSHHNLAVFKSTDLSACYAWIDYQQNQSLRLALSHPTSPWGY